MNELISAVEYRKWILSIDDRVQASQIPEQLRSSLPCIEEIDAELRD